MLKRTTINFVNDTLSKNTNWRILDIGCGYRANKYASVIADVLDLSDFYKEKKFIRIKDKKLPFKDKEFDFVIASHVIEHVEDFEFFLKELIIEYLPDAFFEQYKLLLLKSEVSSVIAIP